MHLRLMLDYFDQVCGLFPSFPVSKDLPIMGWSRPSSGNSGWIGQTLVQFTSPTRIAAGRNLSCPILTQVLVSHTFSRLYTEARNVKSSPLESPPPAAARQIRNFGHFTGPRRRRRTHYQGPVQSLEKQRAVLYSCRGRTARYSTPCCIPPPARPPAGVQHVVCCVPVGLGGDGAKFVRSAPNSAEFCGHIWETSSGSEVHRGQELAEVGRTRVILG